MITKNEVEKYLNDFLLKLNVFNVVFVSRDKNLKTLVELEIQPMQRVDYLKKLTVMDFSDGPLKELNIPGNPDLYVFGIEVKNKEIYVKISMGLPNKNVICVSFHIAEHKIKYAFKQE